MNRAKTKLSLIIASNLAFEHIDCVVHKYICYFKQIFFHVREKKANKQKVNKSFLKRSARKSYLLWDPL